MTDFAKTLADLTARLSHPEEATTHYTGWAKIPQALQNNPHHESLALAPEVPVTDEMVAEIRGRAMCAGWTDNVIAEYYRMMRAKEPMDSWGLSNARYTQVVRDERDAALARAEAAEMKLELTASPTDLDEMHRLYDERADHLLTAFEERDDWKNRALAAETRLAERDASLVKATGKRR